MILCENVFCSKVPEYLHVVINVTEKHGPVFLSLVFAERFRDIMHTKTKHG